MTMPLPADWLLYHDIAPACTALSIQHFLAKNKMVIVSDPLYLPKLAPCDFFYTPTDEVVFEREAVADVAEVQRELLAALDGISVENCRHCFQQWEQCWDHCIQSQGEYFEVD